MASISLLALAASAQIGLPQDEAASAPTSPPAGRAAAVAAPAGVYSGAAGSLAVTNPWVPEAEVDLDGRMSEEIWRKAALLTDFTQYEPVEGVAASQRTEVRVLVTDEAIYFGIRALDERDGVRSTLARRDSYGRSDDYVRLVLDTFGDQRRAFVFQVNPLGIQGDGLWVEGGGGWGDPIDWNPDFLWYS
ncbi:MAG: carbohydrate binding family 9 domain-containing protein, partial [Longimicrobiales bacterium]